MKVLEFIILITLVIACGLGIYTLIEIWPSDSQSFSTLGPQFTVNRSAVITNSTQFYPDMRFPDRKISYSIADDCDSKKTSDMKNALRYLSTETILTFYEKENGGEIAIICSEIAPAPEEKNHFIAGEGGPAEIVDTGLYHIIYSGKISLYRDEKCQEPKIALHELLHALGFDHNNNPKSVLYPVTGCDEQLDKYIIDEINRLYAPDSLPDAAITAARAEKIGRYLSFNIEIANHGLNNTGKLNLSVYAADKIVKIIEVEDIEVGFKKVISVDNLRIPSTAERILFEIAVERQELNIKNNQVELILQA